MSLAAFRKDQSQELQKLAEEHFKHDLRQSDRDTLQSAAKSVGTYASIGSLIGVGLGLFFAFRLRQARTAYFNALRAAEKPTAVQFADGRTEAIPDLTPFVRPTPLGDFATYFFFGAGGLFIGGETGLLTGTWSASRTIQRDPESKARIESAFRKFRADVLRKEIQVLEAGDKSSGSPLDLLG